MATAARNTIRNVSIALLSAGGVATLYRTRMSRTAPLLRVIEFHDLHDARRFADILTYVRRHYHVVTPEECFGNELDSSRVNVLVTFDDGYASWIHIALPVISSLAIKSLFFVSSGLLDAHDNERTRERYVEDRLLITPRETLSWDGLRVLRHAGHTIGGHTVSHSRLSTLQEHELRAEIADDKKRIEAMLDTPITAFAYPFGEHTPQTERFVRQAGYTHAFSNAPRFATLDFPMCIPRAPIDEAASIAALRHAVEGGCDVYESMKAVLGVRRAKMAFNAASRWARHRIGQDGSTFPR